MDAEVGAPVECEGGHWLCERLERRYNVAPEVQQRELAALPLRLFNFAGYGMFVLMPAYALLALRRVYGGRRWPPLARAAPVL